MNNQPAYISLLRAFQQANDDLCLSDWRQLFEKAAEHGVPIFYQLAYINQAATICYFPFGSLLSGVGTKTAASKRIQHCYTTYNQKNDDAFKAPFATKENKPLSQYNLASNGYSHCLDAKLNEDDTLSFSRFFNDTLLSIEIDECVKAYSNAGIELFIANEYQAMEKNINDYIENGVINYDAIKSDFFSNEVQPLFCFTGSKTITATADKFYLLRKDFDTLTGNADNQQSLNAISFWERLISEKTDIAPNTARHTRLVDLLIEHDNKDFVLTVENNEIQETKGEVYSRLTNPIDKERLIQDFCHVQGWSFKKGRRN